MEGYLDGLDEEAVRHVGQQLASLIRPGDIIALSGELGAGKTSFARALLQALGHKGEVPSPSFTLIQTYDHLSPPVAHADLYRLKSPDEAEALGLDDWLAGGALLLEWPERLEGQIWPETLWLRLDGAGTPVRRLRWRVPAEWKGRWPF